jgi:diacylglycerol kinase family enzyme
LESSQQASYAVLLNINARGVNNKVRKAISRLVSQENLFISSSEAEADAHAEQIIKRRYEGVFSGGGDGSLIVLINMLWKHVIRLNREAAEGAHGRLGNARAKGAAFVPYRFPMLGILKLGTGNGWAGVVGSKKGVRQLEHALTGGELSFTPFDLIESEGKRFHFSGMGLDAALLNDYIQFKKLGVRYPALKKYVGTLPGYLASIVTQTIPRELVKQVFPSNRVNIKVINRGPKVFRIEAGGRPVPMRFGRNDMIFSGPAYIVGVATTPNYGFNLKAFPYAMTMPGMMNLRIVQAGILELILNAGLIWEGLYPGPRFHDFLLSDVEIFTSAPMPLQIGGDAEGVREYMRYGIVPEAVKVFDFSMP